MSDVKASVLVVDDEAHQRQVLKDYLTQRGFEVGSASNGREALEALKKEFYDFVITDLTMPEMGGIELVEKAKARYPHMTFLVLTGNGTMESAIAALRAGASDFLLKPVEFTEVERKLGQLLKIRDLEQETVRLKAENEKLNGVFELIAESAEMKKIAEDLKRFVGTNVTVLLNGATGTGKEVIARHLHQKGPRQKGPFIAVNCSAIPETLTESLFFGHEKGAFTGADKRTPGCFEQADGGTLFLDEIGEMDLKLQPKILRVLEEKQITRVGGANPRKVDVRIVAATNRDLPAMVAAGKFREDLFYRLNIVKLELPPLRKRKEDLPKLVRNLVDRHSASLNVKISKIEDDYIQTLQEYDFPGNIRELSNIVERSLLYSSGGILTSESLPLDLKGRKRGATAPSRHEIKGSLTEMVEKVEREIIESALSAQNGDVEAAARALDVSRSSLYAKISKYGRGPT